ncbi:hypothetical protein CA606_04035 [Caulobacter vibrioides]|uniref:YCII-related domain-containing protein n=1 Tax=Caulobacter vibrioides TaxID=155892 RepID=A0A290MWK0_CAUVI|nr:YciI family protein [Caulobacter vibrioides]ATC31590.1 hypothetical protein CA606_04035 [Caulobacter vibrioides]
MAEYILLMHDDGDEERAADWEAYLDGLASAGRLRGGSAVGEGACYRKVGAPGPVSTHLTGFVRIAADSLEDAAGCLAGNPVYEAGGTVEIRLLPEDV